MRIYLDLDDTLNNFTKTICWKLQFSVPTQGQSLVEAYNKSKGTDLTVEDFWRMVPSSVYNHVQETPDARKIVSLAETYGDVAIVTAFPLSLSGMVMATVGKQRWINKHFPYLPVVFTRYKHLLARPDAILIDDMPTNGAAFMQCGGKALLVAQPWNNALPRTLSDYRRDFDMVFKGII